MFSLWRKARRENSAASRLLGSTSLRFALVGCQRACRAWGRPHRIQGRHLCHPCIRSKYPDEIRLPSVLRHRFPTDY
ncbi:hypothetical protein [Thiolapillus sp.]|uniref:hypothetical protein n=1 Tax=Thiolapillus sp. TaxID=2017437 RepID=UPI003AF95F66